MYKISIILTVYNKEKFIDKCLQSLVNQTIFTNLEIIVINDGSSDNSLKICNNYKKKYNNIYIYSKENKGVSSARNLGMQKATAPYVCFIDADDYIKKDYYEFLISLIDKKKYDLGVTGIAMEYSNGKVHQTKKTRVKEFNNKYDILKNFLNGKIISTNMTDKIFKTSIAKKIKFNQNYKIGEDMLYIYEYLKNINTANINLKYCGYYYVQNEESAMHCNDYSAYHDVVKISSKMLNEYKKNDKLYNFCQAHYIYECYKYIEYCSNIKTDSKEFVNNIENINREIKKYPIIKGIIYLSFKQFMGLFLIKYLPKIYLNIKRNNS